LTNADLQRIINSDEVQSSLREKRPRNKVHPRKKNPLKNLGFMIKLNPYAKTALRRDLLAKERRDKKKAEIVASKRKAPVDPKETARKKSLSKRLKKENAKFRQFLTK